MSYLLINYISVVVTVSIPVLSILHYIIKRESYPKLQFANPKADTYMTYDQNLMIKEIPMNLTEISQNYENSSQNSLL